MTNNIEISKDLDSVSKAVAEINATETGIGELVKKYDKIIFDVSTTKGMDDAKTARKEIREPRYNIETLRKAAKAPVLALGRSLDARARELTARLLKLEAPVDLSIKNEDKRVADAKQVVIEAEVKRVEDIRDRITERTEKVDKIIATSASTVVMSELGRHSVHICKCIVAYQKRVIDESYAEFQEQAQLAWDADLARLQTHAVAVKAREDEDKRIAAEREELATLRAEKEERDAEDLARQERNEKAGKKWLAENAKKSNGPNSLLPIEEQLDPYIVVQTFEDQKVDIKFTPEELTLDLDEFSKKFLKPLMGEIAQKAHAEVYEQLVTERLDPDAWVRGHNLLREKLRSTA